MCFLTLANTIFHAASSNASPNHLATARPAFDGEGEDEDEEKRETAYTQWTKKDNNNKHNKR